MPRLFEYTEDSVDFTLFQSEYETLAELSLEQFDTPIDELPVGKALALLLGAVAAAPERSRLENQSTGTTLIDGTMDGPEAMSMAVYNMIRNELIPKAKARGKIILNIAANEQERGGDTVIIRSLEYISLDRLSTDQNLQVS